MNVASLVSLAGGFAVVLGLIVLALAMLKRLSPRFGRSGNAVKMEVLQRMSLGGRQGLAVVRVDAKTILVSVGDGGVRLVTELNREGGTSEGGTGEGGTGEGGTSETARSAPVPFTVALRKAIRNSFVASLVVLSASAAQAQDTTKAAAPQARAPQTQTATQTAPQAKQVPVTVARADSIASKLAPQMSLSIGPEKSGGLKLSGTVGIVVMMGLLTLLPAVVLMMTGFTRILIVMHFLRQAIGAQSAPPAQLVAGLSLLLTLFVMAPTLDEVNTKAIVPWMDGKMEQTQMLKEAAKPFRAFMLRQTRQSDLENFIRLARAPRPATPDDISLIVLTSAFVTSELRVAFQIGFALFLPFIVIDIVVASVLMSMGMMMVPPAMISLPFKLLLFVLVDGWAVVIQGLVQSFA